MRLSAAYARFYKSFNFNQERKLKQGVEQRPWEMFRGLFYPYVELQIDPKITTIVGANESGKSQLLEAIKKAITGERIQRRDLCRFSPFFTVAEGQSCWPHVGVGWADLNEDETATVARLIGAGGAQFDRFVMFRELPDRLTVWTPDEEGHWASHPLSPDETQALVAVLPQPFEIKADVALPAAIPFAYLAREPQTSVIEISRSGTRRLIEAVPLLRSFIGGSPQHLQANFQQVFDVLNPIMEEASEREDARRAASLELGRALLIELAKVDQNGLRELARALDEVQGGYAEGLLHSVNQQLATQMNLRRYWVQDRDFSLSVGVQDRDLVFMITDRTGTSYTFDERSHGLKYFLSYLIQAQVHRPARQRESILLMDEPDTFLSAEAQQDLMRVFRDLAEPPGGGEPLQVIYVTHSPFLLDKNHSARIRVLEKGTSNDGTRVVPNVSRNHYEPLRSAFGAFVGETAFVGAVNLLVEGAADQVLLAGAATEIRRLRPGVENDTLDLNRMVVVPCGSASVVPWTVFRIRGQGADKPPVVVLLDSDKAGRKAAELLKSDRNFTRLLPAEFVLDLKTLGAAVDGWPPGDDIEIEDLLPPVLAHAALEELLREVTKFRVGKAPTFSQDDIKAALKEHPSLMDALAAIVEAEGGHVDKIAFARAVVEVCAKRPAGALGEGVKTYLARMEQVFRVINRAKRAAEKAAGLQRIDSLVHRQARLFQIDNPKHATREQAQIVLEDIHQQLDDSVEGDAIRDAIIALRRDFMLDEDPSVLVGNYDAFLERLSGLKMALRVAAIASAEPPARKKSGKRAPIAIEPGLQVPAPPVEVAGEPAAAPARDA